MRAVRIVGIPRKLVHELRHLQCPSWSHPGRPPPGERTVGRVAGTSGCSGRRAHTQSCPGAKELQLRAWSPAYPWMLDTSRSSESPQKVKKKSIYDQQKPRFELGTIRAAIERSTTELFLHQTNRSDVERGFCVYVVSMHLAMHPGIRTRDLPPPRRLDHGGNRVRRTEIP